MGIELNVNFLFPYLTISPREFWRNWHISLSTWLRDYLYIPLGGNRHGRWMTYRNLMLTMLLGGLWHGASWNFVIWGGYHGALLSLERVFGIGRLDTKRWAWLYPFRAIVTFGLVLVGWVFFRAADLPQSLAILKQMFTVPSGRPITERWHIELALLALVLAVAEEKLDWFEWVIKAPPIAYATALALTLLVVEIFGVMDAAIPFIYFQF